MKRELIGPYIKRHWRKKNDQELAIDTGISVNAVDHRRRDMGLKRPFNSPLERAEYTTRKDEAILERKKVLQIVEDNVRLQKNLDALSGLQKYKIHNIQKPKGIKGEATIVVLASDWHVEEEVRLATVNGVNEYNLQIAKKRADHFFKTLLRLIEIERQNTSVKTLVLGLLGDFITGNIHEDAVKELEENEALIFAQELLLSGLEFLLKNSDLKIICVCHSGNHARITKKQRITTEHQNSQEWLMYRNLALYFKNEKRIEFEVPESYHSYMQIYDWTIRFHHGHNIRYGGGVGGITIPVNKAINEWNKIRRVSLDCFGHFHQAFDGGNFIANGSMIGFNAFAISIKASPEEPTQMMFGIHSIYGPYITRRIKFTKV